MQIAFLGTGLMGAGFVRRQLALGHGVSVWNRSPAKAAALEADGARAFTVAADAVRGADRIHLSLGDDASVDAVLEPIAASIAAATVIVDHTTTAPTPTGERVRRWDQRGRSFVHAPVFMGPANAKDGTGLMLLAGDPGRCEPLQPALQRMTGKVVYLGADPSRAAAFKLFGNLTLLGMMGVFTDVARLAAALGIEPRDAVSLFDNFNPGLTLPARAARVAAGPYSPASFEATMARKDVRLMIEEAGRHGMTLAVMPAVAALFDAVIERGDGAMDATVVGRVPLRPS